MEKLIFDLITRKCSDVPKLRYIDNPVIWEITCTGRPLNPTTHWRAAIATSRRANTDCVIARINEGISLAGDTLTVPADCFFESFRDAVEAAASGRELYFALYGLDDAEHSAEYIEFKIIGLPAVDPPDGPPKVLPDRPGGVYLTRDEILALLDELTPPTTKISVIADPVVEFTVLDQTWGRCSYLDETFRTLTFACPIYELLRVKLRVVSCNPQITGDMVLRPVVNGVEGEPIIIPVGAEPENVFFPLEMNGELAFIRDYADERDTLKDGGAVTAVILNIWLETNYE